MAHFQAVTLYSPISTSIGITRDYFPKPITRIVPTKFKTNKHAVWKHGLGMKFKSKHTVWKHGLQLKFDGWREPTNTLNCICKAQIDSGETELSEAETRNQRVLQVALWVMEGVYIFWLFLLPYAPGDPVWAIKPYTIKILLDLSLNFFFILPLANSAGFHLMEAPVLHPTVEALFNFVIAWTMMFAPLLFTDCKKNRFGGSLEALWVVQMFLTNTLLIPYMAIRLGASRSSSLSKSQKVKSGIQLVMTSGARIIGTLGGLVGFICIIWVLFGRDDAGFGSLADRWDFFLDYIKSDRPGYAFIWDICLYSIFQPWLIGNNLQNVEEDKIQAVRYLRFVPYVGLVAYLWGLANNED
jgi:hypothetical protein